MRWLGVTLICGCSFHGPSLTGGTVDADVTSDGAHDAPAVLGDASACAAVTVVAGHYHTCAQRQDGQLWCWGRNSQGELGVPPSTTHDPSMCAMYPNSCRPTPAAVAMMPGITNVALGDSDTCAIAGDSVYCLGADDGQQFGDNGAGDAYAPREIITRAHSNAVAIGIQHTCSIATTTMDVRCSGGNSYGEVGDNSGLPRATPVHVGIGQAGLPTSLAAGDYHACAIVAGVVSCWGENEQYELDPASSASVFLFPVTPNVATATQLSAGNQHTCAVLADHSARCWGEGGYGQLGDGTFVSPNRVIRTPLVAQVVEIRAGWNHTCARFGAGKVACWGNSFTGPGGGGSGAGKPETIALSRPAISITAGTDHDCAVLDDGTVWCWGQDDHGQLGDGSTVSPVARSMPVQAKLCM